MVGTTSFIYNSFRCNGSKWDSIVMAWLAWVIRITILLGSSVGVPVLVVNRRVIEI